MPALPLLPPDWVLHLESGVSHRLAGCHVDGRPAICRGLAARSLTDGRIEVLAAVSVSDDVVEAVAATGKVAYVAAHPGNNRALHIKGRDAEIFMPTAADADWFSRNGERFVAQVIQLGFDGEHIFKQWYGFAVERLRGVRFTPCGAWDQTPGPGAGKAVDLLP